MPPRSKPARPRSGAAQVRIIGGRWRGSKIDVMDHDGLRPTPDRVRETVFNWLAPHLRGARVLDCCAGSGVLGLEAASRGAGDVTLVEKDRRAAQLIEHSAARLADDNSRLRVVNSDIIAFLQSCESTPDRVFDVVFIDPPYALGGLRAQIWQHLIQYDRLSEDALLYIEWPSHENPPDLPEVNWHRLKTAGQVTYAIAQRQLSR